ncbi:MAG: oligoendopeptidase F [Spirochaetales bacterium]|nr:oligoendopeptidase F [Spirochaetales bacterium]
MPAKKLPERKDIPTEKTWDLSLLYGSLDDWEKDFTAIDAKLKELQQFSGKLSESAPTLSLFLKQSDDFSRLLDKLYTYAHLKSDEDTANSANHGNLDRIKSRYIASKAAMAWFTPEIMRIDDSVMESFLSDACLKTYVWTLRKILRHKPHTLSENEEKLLSMSGEITQLPYNAFSMLNNADIRFPEITDEEGNKVEMTHGLYSRFMESKKREVRKEAFKAMYTTFDRFKHTLAVTLDGVVKAHLFHARTRNYANTLSASLFPDNIKEEIYHNLIKTINDNLPILHDYIAFRKDKLNLPDLNMYDMYVPLIEDYEIKVPWEQACQWVKEAVKPLGSEYSGVLDEALSKRWIDVLECRGKRSGAYSSGCYDSAPYMLLNYNETLSSAFTLAHELGHSLHTWFSTHYQDYTDSEYSIFVAEVASTTNEMLLWNYLMKTTKEDKLRQYLLNHLCEDFRTTVFRQVQFAEFEYLIHDMAEKGKPLTLEELNRLYYDTNSRYYGPLVNADRLIELEWARIPHFYYDFYVYKYATGFSAAVALSEGILTKEKSRINAYIGFLKAGASKDPLAVLTDAGVDLTSPEPIRTALSKFEITLKQLKESLGQ